MSIALFLAYLLFNSLRGKAVFRILFFLPYVTPAIATAVVFRSIFSSHPLSFANGFLNLLGLEGERWLSESRSIVTLLLEGIGFSDLPTWLDIVFPSLALVSVIIYNIWVYVGYDIVILLAGLILNVSLCCILEYFGTDVRPADSIRSSIKDFL